MKKMIALLLALVMVLGLVACGSTETTTTEPTETTTTEPAETTETEETPAVESPKAETEEAPEVTDSSVVDEATGFPASVTLQETTALQGKKIGCSICYKGDEWCAALADALEKLGTYYGADIVCEDGDLNDETQTKQIENMIANNCDILMIDPITPDGSGVALNAAVDAGIPVIIYDGYWTEGEQKAVSTVTWDQYETGVIVANYFLDYLRAQGQTSVRIVELTNAVSTHCQERFEGLHDTFEAATDIEITVLNKYDSQGNRETAYNAISAVVEPYDYIISDVDNGAMGAVSALQAVGNTDVKVLSMGAYGAEPFGKLYENDANYLACLNVDAWILAQFIMDAAIGHFEGAEVPTTTNIALYMVDSSNVTDFWTFE